MGGGAQFDPHAYLSEDIGGDTFDPKAYIAAGDNGLKVLDTTGIAQAGLEHFGNAAAMGYLPQLQAAASQMTPNPNSSVDADLKNQGFKITQNNPSYVEDRDANIARIAKEGQDHPIASAIGTVGGIVAGGAATGAALNAAGTGTRVAGLAAAAKAAKAAGDTGRAAQLARAAFAARMGVAVGTGAAMGAATNPGDTAGELNPLQIGARYENAKTGAITGGVIQGAVEAAPSVLDGIKFAGKKLSSMLSGVSEGDISKYSEATDDINKMIKDSGGNMTEAADQLRQKAQNALRSTRAGLSGQIGKALEAAPQDPVADIQPVIDQLEKVKARLNPNLQSEAHGQIEDMVGRLKHESESVGADGKISVQQLNEITDFLQNRAKSAYMQGGQIFQNAKESAQAAKGAAAVARKSLNSLSPEIAQANNQLALLHSLEDKLNQNLIKPGANDSALFAAGAGSNPRNARMLDAVGKATGFPLLDNAQNLSAAKTFANPSILPNYSTGKSLAGAAVAAGAGHLAGPVGYLAAIPASPLAIKTAINVANKVSPALSNAGSFIQNNPAMLQRVAQGVTMPPNNKSDPTSQLDPKMLGIFRSNPGLIDSVRNPELKSSLMKQLGQPGPTSSNAQDQPSRGPAAWANKGAQNLGIQDPALVNRLMASPKGKQLLIQASDLSPGSKAMQNVRDQIQKGFGNK